MLRLSLALLLIGATCVGCSDDRSSACGPTVREALDPNSLVHVLPGASTPKYLTDPPTSGAHQPTPMLDGPLSEPLPPLTQVGVLEQGRVLVQYRNLDAADTKAIRALNSDQILTAPNPDLPGSSRVVVTAWLVKMQCSAFDAAAIEAFATAHASHDMGHS